MTKYIVVALFAAGLAATVSAETAKDAKAEKQVSAAKTAESAKPAKDARAAERPASKTIETPFGPAATTATGEEVLPDKELSDDPSVSAEERGELVIFRRKTPFGNQVWRKKKAELTADELSILARSPKPAESAKPAKPEADAKPAAKPKASRQP